MVEQVYRHKQTDRQMDICTDSCNLKDITAFGAAASKRMKPLGAFTTMEWQVYAFYSVKVWFTYTRITKTTRWKRIFSQLLPAYCGYIHGELLGQICNDLICVTIQLWNTSCLKGWVPSEPLQKINPGGNQIHDRWFYTGENTELSRLSN